MATYDKTPLIGLVVPNIQHTGGVSEVADFFCRLIERVPNWEYRLISLAVSAQDRESVRLSDPWSWLAGINVTTDSWRGREYKHVGAMLSEVEFQRYRPRPALNRLLEPCDVIQIVAGGPAFGWVARRLDCPVVLQVATLVEWERSVSTTEECSLLSLWRALMTKITSRIEKRAVRAADCVFVENDRIASEMDGWSETTSIIKVPPGINVDLFRPATSSKPPVDDRYILSVGRLRDERKDLSTLFKAYAAVRTKVNNPPHLILAGPTAPGHQDRSTARELGIDPFVSYKGEVDKEVLASLYRHAEAFVLSSKEEGLGLVILEAMASGTPVVATATNGAREIIEDGRTGFLCPIGDPRVLARKLERVLVDSDIQHSIGRNARSAVVESYSERAVADIFLGKYRELM